MTEYLKQPKTAVLEGMSSALNLISTRRDDADQPDLNLTDAEHDLIVEEITYYIQSRFNLEYKELT